VKLPRNECLENLKNKF